LYHCSDSATSIDLCEAQSGLGASSRLLKNHFGESP
jgi:hypothetical protein